MDIDHNFHNNGDDTDLINLDVFKRQLLVAKSVHERAYENAEDNHAIYQYEMRCRIEDAPAEQRAVYHGSGNLPDRAAFLNFARLGFQGNALIGLKKDSLGINRLQDSDQERRELNRIEMQQIDQLSQAKNHLSVSIDMNENAIFFEFNFDEDTDDIEITFIVLMRKRLEFNLSILAHFRIEESAHQYHGNDRIHGYPEISQREHFGYNRDTIMHLMANSVHGTPMQQELPQAIDEEIQNLRLFNSAAGNSNSNSKTARITTAHVSHRDNTSDEKKEMSPLGSLGSMAKRGISSLYDTVTETVIGKRPRTGQRSKPEMVTFILEMTRMPGLIAEIDKHKNIGQLKLLVKEAMEHAKFTPFALSEMRILVNFNEVADDNVLGELYPDGQNKIPLRMALVTQKPSLPADYHHRELNPQLNDAQRAAVHQINTLRILLRNVAACNSNATNSIQPRLRTRFNYPETPTENNVSAADLGAVVLELAAQVRLYSHNLMKLADQMCKDRNFQVNSPEHVQFQTDIQNCMDCARYAGPMFKNISSFVVPAARQPPRIISVMPPQ